MTAHPEKGLRGPNLSLELAYWRNGKLKAGGIDEAGRGAWAGPVAAAVVVLPQNPGIGEMLQGVRDSKLMLPAQRTYWAGRIKSMAAAWAVGMASHQEIDSIGIIPATRLAARRALEQLPFMPDALFLDWLALPQVKVQQVSIIKGDNRVLSVSCASVLAKTTRDALMVEMDSRYPAYGFAAHKGYGTATHMAVLQSQGPCPIHRLSYKPLKEKIPDIHF